MNNQNEMNTPETLADLLDRALPPNRNEIHIPVSMEPTDLPVDELVSAAARLSAAPKLSLSPEMLARIEAQVRTTPIKRNYLSFQVGLAVAGIILVMFVILLTSQRESNNPDRNIALLMSGTPSATIELTVTSSQTPSQTATGIPTATQVIVSATNTLPPSDIPLSNTAAIPTVAANTQTPSETPITPIIVSATPHEQITVTPQPIEIIIEGAIEKIDKNTLTIYGFHIQLAADDPLLKALYVGDVVRIEGNVEGTGENLLIYALKLELENEDAVLNEVYIQGATGEIWRDDGTCANRPPDWAVANGWRKRCEQPGNPAQNHNNNQGNNGMGKNDKD